MKAKITIPSGWYLLKPKMALKRGDRNLSMDGDGYETTLSSPASLRWEPYYSRGCIVQDDDVAIRKRK